MEKYLKIIDETGDPIPTRVPLDSDNTLTLRNLSLAFPDACGLKYRGKGKDSYADIPRCEDDTFRIPEDAFDCIAVCIYPENTEFVTRSEFEEFKKDIKDMKESLNFLHFVEPATEEKKKRHLEDSVREEDGGSYGTSKVNQFKFVETRASTVRQKA